MSYCYTKGLSITQPRMAISAKGKQWKTGEIIDIHFLEGTDEQKQFVIDKAKEWMKHANLWFNWNAPRDESDVRISFREGQGAWSYIGTDALFIHPMKPTMNFGWLDQATVLHEFGHMLGLLHEHQNPDGGIVWNHEAVIKDLSGPPNYWDEATIWHNVLSKIGKESINGTQYDPKSIMLYPFPDHWTMNGKGTKYNTRLSAHDIAHIGELYPSPNLPTLPDPEITSKEAPKKEPTKAKSTRKAPARKRQRRVKKGNNE